MKVKHFKIACFEVNILLSRSPKGQKRPKTVTIYHFMWFFLGDKFHGNIFFYIRGQCDVIKVKVI